MRQLLSIGNDDSFFITMRRLSFALVSFLPFLALGALATGPTSQHGGTTGTTADDDPDACTLYLAPSTLENAGLGVFSTVSRQPGEILDSTADICIPFIDMYWHQPKYENPFHDYYWHGKAVGILTESTTGTVEAACLGLDCVLNCHIGLVNVLKSVPTYDEAGLHRAKHAGAGARSPYGVEPTVVARTIPAGGELFKFYGDEWFASRTRLFGHLPLSQDYQDAQNLLQQISRLVNNKTVVQADLYRIVMDMSNQQETSRTLNALPDTVKDCFQATEQGIASTLQPRHAQSIEWLEKHGRCVDHIVMGRSTLPDAGNGAFARHNIKKGQIVTTSPLHHFTQWNNAVMEMYNITKHDRDFPPHDDENDKEQEDEQGFHYQRHLDQVENYQIAVNYCFSHIDTSLLLCPYGPGVNYMNHRALPNVAIQWAQDFAGHNPKLVESANLQDLDQLPPTLAFDYVATRDIKAGEELFLDYGQDYNTAWYRHLIDSRQELKNRSQKYSSGPQWNEIFANALVRTEEEQSYDPYPENIQVRCHYDVALGESPRNFRWISDEYGFPCTIIDRFVEGDDTLYTVDVEIWPEAGYSTRLPKVESIQRVLRTDIPRHALRFFDVPGTSDLHLSGAFRHWIGLPDDMLPDQWRNELDDDDDDDDDDDEE